MSDLITLNTYPVKNVLRRLLQDKTTGKNIIFATDNYIHYGCEDTDQITENALLGFDSLDIQPRVMKASAEQSERTRKKAEVFTPTWIVRRMNDHCDSVWRKGKHADDWQKYVSLRILEITCGEAPFLVTRYDTTTGEPLPVSERTGMLDRKLKAIQTDDEQTWLRWVFRAYEMTYGYEFQGDNLLIARINLLQTFCDYLEAHWGRKAADSELNRLSTIIAWNLWQMDGLKDTVPIGIPRERDIQLSLLETEEEPEISVACEIYRWTANTKKRIRFSDLKGENAKMKFDFVIGNPPYQQDSIGANESDTALYHHFYNASISIADRVELITPARFLFNAGATPKDWNEAMLSDEHFKVLFYEPKSDKIFNNTDIKGGVVIAYRDITKTYGAIGAFTAFPELNAIKKKVEAFGETSLSDVITNRGLYRYSQRAYDEQPTELAKTADARIAPSAFERMPLIFTDTKPNDGNEYIQIFGLLKGERVYKWVRKDYVKDVPNLYRYKVMIPKANGSGAIGEVLSTPLCGVPLCGFTETFIFIGETDSRDEAEATLKYVKTKFARTMLGILKVTQNNAKPTWKYVPLQDFTANSDIDWSRSIAEIDRQLYQKYGLTQEEIDFIETHVKEME